MHAHQTVHFVPLIQIALTVFLKTEIFLIGVRVRLNIILNLTTIALSVLVIASHAQTQPAVNHVFI